MLFKTRHYIQLAIVMACLGWGGYQLTVGVLADAPEESTAAATVEQDGQTLDAEYQGLPTAVARAIKSVIATQRIISMQDESTQKGLAGSGVVISDDQVVTAGHNVQDGKGLACSQMMVVSPGVLSSANAAKDMVTHASVRYGSSQDLAVLTVRASANFRELPDAVVAQDAPQPGETVYFINYQPSSGGTGRTPLATDKMYAEPAVFSATVLGSSDLGLAVATGGGKSFGIGEPDVMLRKGASGGAVVTAKGELIGISVASQSLAADRTASSLLKSYGVSLGAGKYQVVYVQTVKSEALGTLKTGMVSCKGGE